MKRQNGFYWVKYQNEWIIAQMYNESWLIPGNENCFEYDLIFDEILDNPVQNPNLKTETKEKPIHNPLMNELEKGLLIKDCPFANCSINTGDGHCFSNNNIQCKKIPHQFDEN